MKRLEALAQLVCCPVCHGDLENIPTELAHKEVKRGICLCHSCELVVGVIEDFYYDFQNFDKDSKEYESIAKSAYRPQLVKQDLIPEVKSIRALSDEIVYSRKWYVMDEMMMASDGKGVASYEANCTGFNVRFMTHPWSGVARILIDGEFIREIDLYAEAEHRTKTFYLVENMEPGRHRLDIIATGTKNDKARMAQVIIESLGYVSGRQVLNKYRRIIGNHGEDFPPKFLELVKAVPESGHILDCGGGLRQFDDERYFNFDYSRTGWPDVHGDGHSLPFKSNSFDLVLSQGVLEHMKNPFLAAKELHRVLKPGGQVYSDMAFMQPLHGAPFHFFNATVPGIEQLFDDFTKIDSGGFGSLRDPIEWIFREANVSGRLGRRKTNRILSLIDEAEKVIPDNQRDLFPSAVYYWGEK